MALWSEGASAGACMRPRWEKVSGGVLKRAATHPSRSVRDCVTEQVPTFGALVEAVASALP